MKDNIILISNISFIDKYLIKVSLLQKVENRTQPLLEKDFFHLLIGKNENLQRNFFCGKTVEKTLG